MRRAAILLAILAALLLGAPSAVLGAPPNRLEAAAAQPSTGTVLTTFHFSVRYVSSAGNPADRVKAGIGPLDVPLHLTSGTATDGTWSGSAQLPEGTWTVTYQATVDKGLSPSLKGPFLTVLGGPSASPEGRPGGGNEPAPTSSGEDVADPSSGSGESPAAGPQSSAKPGKGTSTAEPAPRSSGSAGDGPDIDDTPEPKPGGNGRGGDDGRRRGGAAPRHPSPDATAGTAEQPLESEPPAMDRGELLVLLGVIVTVATVALLGTGWLLSSRERDDEPASAAAEAAVALRRARRQRRTATVLPANDPVLAALGLQQPDDPPQPTRGAARGAAPRPRKGPPPPR